MFHLRTFLFSAALFASMWVRADEITVFAAASLSDVLNELSPIYAKTSGDTLRLNFSASGTLTRQIREGAPADVIVSADELRIDQMEKEGLLLHGTRRAVLTNTLVIVTPSGTNVVASPADLATPAVRRAAFADPASVPVGTYSKEYLLKIGLWDSLQPKAVFFDNVRAVLATVEAGNADAGIVYKTDALISKKVKIAYEVSAYEGSPIIYPVAVIKNTQHPFSAKKFVVWLTSAEAQSVFAKYGFLPPPSTSPPTRDALR